MLSFYSVFDCRTRMAGSVFYLAPVDNASGKIFGKKQKWMAVRRLTGKRQRGCSVIGERTTAVTEKEQTWRTQFAQIAQMTRERLEDPAFMASDQAAFTKQSKHKTLRAFVFDICKEELLNGK